MIQPLLLFFTPILIGSFLGPLGLLGGCYVGYLLRRQFKQTLTLGSAAREQAIQIMYRIMGHFAKSDGRVSEQEIHHARTTFQELQLTQAQQKAMMLEFNKGKSPEFNLNHQLQQFRSLVQTRQRWSYLLIDMLIRLAAADGQLNQNHYAYIAHCAEVLAVPRWQLAQLFIRACSSQSQGGFHSAHSHTQRTGPDAYTVLGVNKQAPFADIQLAYRKLISKYHPDKMIARNAPEAEMQHAKEKAQTIQAAYDELATLHGRR